MSLYTEIKGEHPLTKLPENESDRLGEGLFKKSHIHRAQTFTGGVRALWEAKTGMPIYISVDIQCKVQT